MTRDKNKDITEITYNYMNLPEHIYFGNGNGIEYFYTAAGQKIQKKVYDTTNNTVKEVDYLDGFQYTGGVLNFFPHSEGYVSATESGVLTNPILYNYVYNYTDHLGNIRLSYTKDPVSGDLEIMEENNYYPFGLKHSVYSGPKQKYELVENEGESMARPTYVYQTDYQYKYNGKEFQDELGLNIYDYGVRNYDPALGRWVQLDGKAEVYVGNSPYHFSADNPIYFMDVDGDYYVGTDGKPVTTSIAKDGTIKLSSNASTDLQRMATLVNTSGSETAKSQFFSVGNNKSKVHFQIIKEAHNQEGQFGKGLWGLHQAHDKEGNALTWDIDTGTFNGEVAFTTDENGDPIYAEATISIFEGNIDKSIEDLISSGQIREEDAAFIKDYLLVSVNGHEEEHDLNKEDIKAIKSRQDKDPKNDIDRDVEDAANKVESKIKDEIIDNIN